MSNVIGLRRPSTITGRWLSMVMSFCGPVTTHWEALPAPPSLQIAGEVVVVLATALFVKINMGWLGASKFVLSLPHTSGTKRLLGFQKRLESALIKLACVTGPSKPIAPSDPDVSLVFAGPPITAEQAVFCSMVSVRICVATAAVHLPPANPILE